MAIETPVQFTGTVGAAATIANTGFDAIYPAGGSMTFTDTWKPYGNPVSVDANGTTTSGYVLGLNDITATDVLAFEQPYMVKTLPASEQALFSFFNNDSSEARQISLVHYPTTPGAIRIRDGANVNAWTSAGGLMVANVPMIVSVYFTRHATAGQFQVRVTNADTGAVIVDSGLLTGKNTGSLPVTRIKHTQVKSSSTSTVVSRGIFGEPRWDRAATGLLAPIEDHHPAHYGIGGVAVPVNVHLGINGVAVQII